MMSRSQQLRIEELTSINAGLREQVAGLKGQAAGERRGEIRVAVQLADRNTDLTRERDAEAGRARRATRDVRTALRLIAAHVLDLQGGATPDDSAQLLLDEFITVGLPLRGALLQLQAERADNAAPTAAACAAAVAAAPLSRTS
jgi:hypothetical protein